jgi:hypothetical protein
MKSKKTFFAVLVAVISFLFVSSHIHGVIWDNDIAPVFSDDEGQKSQGIETNVINGASLFLQSQSQVLLLLNEYELSGIQTFNSKQALEYVENAINLLERAWTRYVSARTMGKKLGYNPVRLNVFATFDYDGYILENRLNSEIAKKVQGYLSSGDIVGIYQKTADDIANILITLNSIKENLKIGIKPGISLFWKLFQQYAESSLFGNYTTIMARTVLDIP